MTTTKKELSYFRLKLENYLSEHFPEMLSDKPFITARADEALISYCDAVAQGFSHPEAESMASEVLHRGLHFSKYDTLVSVLENEFEAELPAPPPPSDSHRYCFATRRYKTSLGSTISPKVLLQAQNMRNSTPNSPVQ